MTRGALLPWGPWVVAAAILVVGVTVSPQSATLYFWTGVAVMALYAMSVNLLIGHAGVPSFGQAAYFGIGAYAVGLLITHVGAPMPVTVVAGGVFAGIAAFGVGLVGLRVSGLAFSMLTLAFAQALYTLTYRLPVLGGENGFVGILPGTLLGVNLAANPMALWIAVLTFVIIGVAALGLIVSSPFGRTLQMIRDDPRRAEFLGLPVFRYQTAAFVISGFIAGCCGADYEYVQGVVGPDYVYWTRSGEPIIMAIIGGIHSFVGPIVGAVLYLWTVDALSKLTPAWVLWVGLVFLLVVLAAPTGVLGLSDTVRRWRDWLGQRRSREEPPRIRREAKPE